MLAKVFGNEPEDVRAWSFGPRRRMLTTTAAFTLVGASDQAEEGAAVVDSYETCADLGARLVGLRGQGRSVGVVAR